MGRDAALGLYKDSAKDIDFEEKSLEFTVQSAHLIATREIRQSLEYRFTDCSFMSL